VGPKTILDIAVNTIMPTLMAILRRMMGYQTAKLAFGVHSYRPLFNKNVSF
jgi:hypothetical protein